ncbi:MAG: GNAT family N-acetyltransferase [Lachnospiraceae bacterium]|nr:GNAT family N-acetyltransferase [Lachnospiraceae bacterium]
MGWNFFDENGLLGENETILLRQIRQEEYVLFGQVLAEGKNNKADYQTEDTMSFYEEEIHREDALYCAIIRKDENLFCGYIGISELSEEPWEFAIELFKRYHRQGIGSRALSLFLESVKERTGVGEFKSCVEGSNLASQKLMEKSKGNLIDVTFENGTPVMTYHHII